MDLADIAQEISGVTNGSRTSYRGRSLPIWPNRTRSLSWACVSLCPTGIEVCRLRRRESDGIR